VLLPPFSWCSMRSIVIGIGNPFRTDDAVGVQVVCRLSELLRERTDVCTAELYAGGMRLMEAMAGFDRAIVIDASVTPEGRPGTLRWLESAEWPRARNTCSTHDVSLGLALEFGRLGGLSLPGEIRVLAVEAKDVETIGETLTPEVAKVVPAVIEAVLQQIGPESS